MVMSGQSAPADVAVMKRRSRRSRRTGLAVVACAGICAVKSSLLLEGRVVQDVPDVADYALLNSVTTGDASVSEPSSTAFVSGLRGSGSSPSITSRSTRYASGSQPFDLKNPVKDVSSTLDDFYAQYSQPPVLPMYRPYLVDMMSQAHLISVDSRFKYDAIFAWGLWDSFNGMMKNYDQLVGEGNSDKIWNAMVAALGMDPVKVRADAESMIAYAKGVSPADALKHMEGTVEASEKKASEAFANIKSSLYNNVFSVGLFRTMDLVGVEVTKANVEEWAKALSLTPSKVLSDFQTWKLSQAKLQQAEEMLREVQIRQKKQLAEKLEAKAKALSAKAAAA